jgi:hypothetical protein
VTEPLAAAGFPNFAQELFEETGKMHISIAVAYFAVAYVAETYSAAIGNDGAHASDCGLRHSTYNDPG